MMISLERYSRQIILEEIGESGQETLRHSKVAVVGLGALGSVVSELLVRAGVLQLTLIDRDIVEMSNLQRQALYTEADVGKLKVDAITQRLADIHSLARETITSHAVHLHAKNIEFVLSQDYDLIIDCTDNIYVRRLLEVFRLRRGIALLFGSAVADKGLCALLDSSTIGLGSFLPDNAKGESCSAAGVFAALTHIIGSLQSQIALLFLLGRVPLDIKGKLLSFDLGRFSLRKFSLPWLPSDTQKEYPVSPRVIPYCRGTYQVLCEFETKIDLASSSETLRKRFETVKLIGNMLKVDAHRLFADGRALIVSDSLEKAIEIYDLLTQN